MDNLILSLRLGLFQDGLDVIVQDLSLKGHYAETKVSDDGLEVVVVGDLFKR